MLTVPTYHRPLMFQEVKINTSSIWIPKHLSRQVICNPKDLGFRVLLIAKVFEYYKLGVVTILMLVEVLCKLTQPLQLLG